MALHIFEETHLLQRLDRAPDLDRIGVRRVCRVEIDVDGEAGIASGLGGLVLEFAGVEVLAADAALAAEGGEGRRWSAMRP